MSLIKGILNNLKEESIIKRTAIIAMCYLSLLLFIPKVTDAKEVTIQERIDRAMPGDIIDIKQGEYNEHIIITKPLHLRGVEGATFVQNSDKPTITIQSNDVIIENLALVYMNNQKKAPAILVNGSHNKLQDINIHTSSTGIRLEEADYNRLSNLTITGNDQELMRDRKHGIDLWQSHYNDVSDTVITHVLDGIYLEKSTGNNLYRNETSYSRYGFHLMFTKHTTLTENESYENISGMMIMGTNGSKVTHNVLRNNERNIQSLGLLLFDTIHVTVSDNMIHDNRIGIFIEDASENMIVNNFVQRNYIGVQFKAARKNKIMHNSFVANIVHGQAESSSDNDTRENLWGDHHGLDVTGDGLSDIRYKVDPFFLHITDEYPPYQLLFQSPGMIFLEQLMSSPDEMTLIDSSPLLYRTTDEVESEQEQSVTYLFFSFFLLVVSFLIIYLGVKKDEKF